MKQIYILLALACILNISNLSAQNYNETFESGMIPSNLTIVNDDGLEDWKYNASASGFGAGNGSISFDNYSQNNTGASDWFILPDIDLYSGSFITFDVAYASYDATFCDALEVAVSTDNGNNYTAIYYRSCSTLATAPNNTSLFTPTSTQWRTETIDLSAYDNTNNIKIGFKNESGYGQQLFIDNINVNSGTLSTTTFNTNNMTLYPNPAKNVITLNGITQPETIEIYNIAGQKILQTEVNANNNNITISKFTNGLYFLKIKDTTLKFIKN